MTIFRTMLVFLFIVFVAAGARSATGDEPNWLVGKWELSLDPDGSAKDWVEFSAAGEAFSISPEGRRVAGRYSQTGPWISIVYIFNGKEIPIQMRASDDHLKLLAVSKRTGNTSEYRKLP
ncbi:MAG: hypothetical protein ABI411_04855 [Tahibacter sp.]